MIKNIYKYDDYIIVVKDDNTVEGSLNDTTNALPDILFYNDERGKRCGTAAGLPLEINKASKLIRLFNDALKILNKN